MLFYKVVISNEFKFAIPKSGIFTVKPYVQSLPKISHQIPNLPFRINALLTFWATFLATLINAKIVSTTLAKQTIVAILDGIEVVADTATLADLPMILVMLVDQAKLDMVMDMTSLEPVPILMVVNVEALKTFYLLAFLDPVINPTTMVDTTMADTITAV